ncbi:phage tail domain-containing protein [Liquorilactobacillus hordei]|uniref:phage tail domain-containing protein n=1 Tax=Liquorilactobacillus hordei TaxID=468911 RepID=UPI0039EB937C
MDLLVTQLDGTKRLLSQYNILITSFEEGAPTVSRNSSQLDQRNGSIDFGGWHKSKTIKVEGYMRANSQDEEELLRERIYALLTNVNGYYITQFKNDDFNNYERPGEQTGELLDKITNYPSHKRFLVYCEEPSFDFIGMTGGKILYKLSADFITLKLPYGESIAKDILITKGVVPYKGTVDCNQLEQQFSIQFVATKAATTLKIMLDEQTFLYSGSVTVGDVFLLGGFSFTKNALSIVSNTNYQYFIFHARSANHLTSSIAGVIKILGFQNLYA